jgi:hypothetical protein
MMFQSLFARDFSLRGCTYLLGLILNAQNAASGGSRRETMFLSSYLGRGMGGDLKSLWSRRRSTVIACKAPVATTSR